MLERSVVSLTSALALACAAQTSPPEPARAPVDLPAVPAFAAAEPGGAAPPVQTRVVEREGCGATCDGVGSEALSQAVVRRARHARDCYDRELLRDPKTTGKLLVTLSIARDGASCTTVVTSSTMEVSTQFEGCLIRVFEGGYPAPSEGCVQVVIPLNFVPAAAPAAP